MGELSGLVFRWLPGKRVDDNVLRQCSDLFSHHYGVYDQRHQDPAMRGKQIRMPPARQRKLLEVDGAWAALAYVGDHLVGYAFLVRAPGPGEEVVSWVTQLVIHTEYQNQRVASRLLHAAWGLSDQHSWGLATANPYAVRALEYATRRRCDPRVIGSYRSKLGDFADRYVNYVCSSKFDIADDRSVVDTGFFVSHSDLEAKMAKASNGKAWMLGQLRPGHEWLSFVFRSQNPSPLSLGDFERLVKDHDGIVREAYGRMRLEDDSHKWTRRAAEEASFAIDNLRLPAGARVLDVGCGQGRHALELARKGYSVVGVDFVDAFVNTASRKANEQGLASRVKFLNHDARDLNLGETFDAVLCLYDVIGSFPDDADNAKIVQGAARHLKPGGGLLMSVLNKGLVDATAVHRGPIRDHLDDFLRLPPSGTMERTGEIFDPQFIFFDPDTSLVYRKEQFTLDELPCELVVRDRRYAKGELEAICRGAGVEPVWARHVRSGHWDEDYPPGDGRAKEVLLLAQKR